MAGFTLEYQNKMAVQQFANAMYDLQVGSDTMDQVLSDIDLLGSTDAAFNSYYDFTYGQATDAEVAATMVANFGIDAAEAADAEAYIAGVLGAADPGAKGAAANDIIETFASLTDDAVFGPAATAWNAEVSTAMDYDGTADLTAGEVVAPETHFMLSSASDDIDGSAVADTFDAPLVQDGGVTNSLSSADHLDGGAGDDLLNAVLVPEFFGSTGDYQVDVQPAISGIETIQLEAQDARVFDGYGEWASNSDGFLNNSAVFDAKDVTGVDSIGSYFSDGDLVIENLTTLTDDGVARNTVDLTITMDHTDNFDHDGDASDLTVLFDEDYLLSGQQTTASAVAYYLLDEESSDYATEPLLNIERDGVKFILDGVEYTIGMSLADSQAADDWGAFTAQLQASLAALQDPTNPDYNEDLVGLSFVHDTDNTYFANDSTFNDAGVQVSIDPIVLIDSLGREIDGSGFTSPEEATGNFDIYGTWDNNPSDTLDLPVAINVELNKVGRDSEGGNLFIGGKHSEGIQDFHVAVLGDDTKPSNLGSIDTNSGYLEDIYISTHDDYVDGSSFASLTIGEDFATAPHLFNADAFLGDLTVGSLGSTFTNIDVFTATGGGDVTYFADYTDAGGFPSLSANAFTTTTGAGSDTLSADVNDGAQLTMTSGTGNDSITVTIDGADDSGSTLSFADINSSGGNNTVTTSSALEVNSADIDLGSGTDTVYGNKVNITADTGAGNDVIYAENTGDMTAASLAAGASAVGSTDETVTGIRSHAVSESELLYGRQVQVTLSTSGVDADDFTEGFESALIDIDASNGYLTTEGDLFAAIATAINDDDVLSTLASASINSNGLLTIDYLVDGVSTVTTGAAVAYTIFGDSSDLTSAEISGVASALQAEYSDSQIDNADATTAYDAVTVAAQDILVTSAGADGTTLGENTVNGGTGDDVIVLSSNDTDTVVGVADAVDTVVFDAGSIGNDTIVHFEVGDTGDVLDFTGWLDDVVSDTTSIVSQLHYATDLETDLVSFTANSVVDADFTDVVGAYGSGTITFDGLTDAQLLAALNGTATGGDATAFAATQDVGNTLVGDDMHAILLIENDDGTDANAGEYIVAQVTASYADAGTDGDTAFDAVTIIGTVDFGSTIDAVTDANFA